MSGDRAPLAAFPAIPPITGVRLAAGAAGLRYAGRDDLALVELAPGTTVGGVFTRNAVPGHPITWCRTILPAGKARALVVNAGNANVLTGKAGDAAVRAEAAAAAELVGSLPEEVFVASTGVIGERLPVEKILERLPALHGRLAADGWEAAARAIMTTDTFPKGVAVGARIGQVPVRIAGIAKGSGMIQPDMATMLAYIFTDARLPAPILQELVAAANERAFRSITVDSDTSTSDMLLAFATGAADHPAPSHGTDPLLEEFAAAFNQVAVDLARQIVRDGEGAKKLIEIRVEGAVDKDSARRIGLTIANSPLVKTAIAGEDANWGRIVAAVGKAREPITLERLGVAVGGHVVAQDGARVEGLDERPVAAHLAGDDIAILVTVGDGGGAATVWTCDLTHDYITINAEYRS
jgi:glutamate N-acetyltransferase/amino-acid N-acetyltransferase